jgi:predicted nucleic acid-binding Zn finger protein
MKKERVRDYTFRNHFCECSNVATIKRGNAKICQRCADLDSKAQPLVAGKSRKWGHPSQQEYFVSKKRASVTD